MSPHFLAFLLLTFAWTCAMINANADVQNDAEVPQLRMRMRISAKSQVQSASLNVACDIATRKLVLNSAATSDSTVVRIEH